MFKYVVTFYDSDAQATATSRGLVSAKSWGKAIEKVRQYYGVDDVFSIAIEEWEDILESDEIIEGLRQ